MNSKKLKCLLFPKPHFNHLLFLFYFVSSFFKQFLLNGIKAKDNLSIPLFKLYIYNLGDFLSLIPYIIIKKKTKHKIKDGIKIEENSFYIYNDKATERFQKAEKK